MPPRPPGSEDHALVVHQASSLAPASGSALAGPSAPVRAAVPALLGASVAAYGDVVAALLTDLDRVSQDVAELSWLAGTGQGLQGEAAWQSAAQQLQWWDSFLASLPNPTVQSDLRRGEQEREKAQRAGAVLRARQAAREAHREAVDAQLADPSLSAGARARLSQLREDPGPGEWQIDLNAFVAAALAQLPAERKEPPISARDLDPMFNFAGFNAVRAMRAHPDLGPRAASMDAALSATLRQELGLSAKEAMRHSSVLTDLFWVALRRALAAGSHQLATSLHLLASAQEAPVQSAFTRELLESWVVYLSEIPAAQARPALVSRIPLIGRFFEKKEVVEGPKQLTDGGTGRRRG